MDRRAFVGTAAAGLLNACASLATTTVTPERGVVRLRLADHPTLDRPSGFLKIRTSGSDRLLYVLNVEPGQFVVVSPICKHLGCTVDVDGPRLLCPCHGSTYARDGSVLRGPTQRPLDRFRSELSADGVLTVYLEAADQ